MGTFHIDTKASCIETDLIPNNIHIPEKVKVVCNNTDWNQSLPTSLSSQPLFEGNLATANKFQLSWRQMSNQQLIKQCNTMELVYLLPAFSTLQNIK